MSKRPGRSPEYERSLPTREQRRAQQALDAPRAIADYKRAAEDALNRMAHLRAARLKREAEMA
jgi:hypothetical protein